MNQVTEQEIVEIVKAHLSKMGWEYASHPELKPMFDLYTRIKQHGIAPPDGHAIVPKSIHPLDTSGCEKVVALLANAPCAKAFKDPNDYYQSWWSQLLAAAILEGREKGGVK